MTNYIAWSKDEENLFASSSGGIFLELAKETLKRKGLVVGVTMPNLLPYYTITMNLDGVKAMRGSKYLRAILDNHIMEHIKNFKGIILFVGLPCTIKMMRNKFKNKYNILYVQLFCHGCIKQEIFNKYIQKHFKNAESISFRNKEKGWRNSVHLCSIKKGLKYRDNGKLMKNYINFNNIEKRCKLCKRYKLELVQHGDILLGDYWKCPSHLENKKGTSQVITVTTNGQKFFDSLDNIERKENSLNKVAIMGGASINNNGSMILTQNFIDYLSKERKNIGFTLVGGEGNPWEARKDILIGYIKSLFRPGQDQSILEQHIRDCQTIVYLGGDHFIGKMKRQHKLKWLIHFFFTCINFSNLKRTGKKVYLVSQTMGQFPFYIKPFIKRFFGKLDKIYCRDTFSMKELQKLDLKNIALCYDLAFLPLQNENNCRLSPQFEKRYTVLVISDLWRDYCKTPQDFIDNILATIRHMRIITKLPVYIMTHSSKKTPIGEEFVLRELRKRITIQGVYFLENDTAVAQRNILGRSKLNVSLRMHGSLSSLEQGVPVIPIAYSVKYSAIYSDLNLSDLVATEFSQVGHKIWYVWKHYSTIKERIEQALKNSKKMALKPIIEIAEEIK